MTGRHARRIILSVVVALAFVLVAGGGSQRQARADGPIALTVGCNNIVLPFPSGVLVQTVAGAIQPANALTGIFRFDPVLGRFLAFSPLAPRQINDLVVVGAPLQPVFICVSAIASLVVSTTLLFPAPATGQRGLIAAPGSVRRGERVEVQVGTVPGWACVGGVNIPIGPTVRFVPVEVAAAPNGIALIRFDTLTTDATNFAHLSVRCADGQFIELWIQLL